jgi:hypothetical protein
VECPLRGRVRAVQSARLQEQDPVVALCIVQHTVLLHHPEPLACTAPLPEPPGSWDKLYRAGSLAVAAANSRSRAWMVGSTAASERATAADLSRACSILPRSRSNLALKSCSSA